MEPIKIQVEITISEEAKTFLTGLVTSLVSAPVARKPAKKTEHKGEEVEVKEEPAPEENAPKTPEIEAPKKEFTREDARVAINEARERGFDNDTIKGCLPKGKVKVTELTPEELAEFIKKVKEL